MAVDPAAVDMAVVAITAATADTTTTNMAAVVAAAMVASEVTTATVTEITIIPAVVEARDMVAVRGTVTSLAITINPGATTSRLVPAGVEVGKDCPSCCCELSCHLRTSNQSGSRLDTCGFRIENRDEVVLSLR